MIVASRRRVVVLYVLVAALLLVLVGRVWYIQVMSGSRLHQARREQPDPQCDHSVRARADPR